MGQFKAMSKMKTTEPSVELKLKKGGKVKKMQMGGALPAAAAPEMMPKRRRMAQPMARPATRPMAAPMGARPMMSKDGGHAESKEMKKDISKDKAMIKKAVKQHDEQQHKGGKGTKLTLKKGGAMACKDGGHMSMSTKGVDGYKAGGKMCKY